MGADRRSALDRGRHDRPADQEAAAAAAARRCSGREGRPGRPIALPRDRARGQQHGLGRADPCTGRTPISCGVQAWRRSVTQSSATGQNMADKQLIHDRRDQTARCTRIHAGSASTILMAARSTSQVNAGQHLYAESRKKTRLQRRCSATQHAASDTRHRRARRREGNRPRRTPDPCAGPLRGERRSAEALEAGRDGDGPWRRCATAWKMVESTRWRCWKCQLEKGLRTLPLQVELKWLLLNEFFVQISINACRCARSCTIAGRHGSAALRTDPVADEPLWHGREVIVVSERVRRAVKVGRHDLRAGRQRLVAA